MKNKNQSNFKVIARLIKFMKKLLPVILLAVFFAVVGFLVTVTIPAILVSLGLDALLGKSIESNYLWILVGLALMRGLFRYGEHYFGHYVAFKVLADFRREIFAKLRRLAPAKLDSQDSGVLLKLIGEDVEALEVFFAHTLAPVTTGSIVGLILFIYYAKHSFISSIIALVVYVGLAVIIPNVFAKKLKVFIESQHEARKDYTSYFLDSLKGMKDLIQLRKDEERFSNLSNKSKVVNEKERAVAKLNFSQFTISFLLIGFGVVLFAVNNMIMVKNGSMDFKLALITMVVFSSSFAPFLELSRLPLGLGRALQAAKQTFALLDEEESENNLVAGMELDKIEQICFDEVSFSYPNRDQVILKEVNLNFNDKKIVGLIGESGSGKSTLMKLVMAWYRVNSGNLYINEQNINKINSRNLQKKIAYIPQNPQIFSQTIRENLVLGNDCISDEMILDMAEKCRMKEKILSTENGLDTIINSEKTIFSSGEMQRLELIRAFLKQADIYIFDEPTSNLDTLNEAAIIKLIKENSKAMVFLISHRMSTVASADIIYKVENGRVNEVKKA